MYLHTDAQRVLLKHLAGLDLSVEEGLVLVAIAADLVALEKMRLTPPAQQAPAPQAQPRTNKFPHLRVVQ